jgi:quinol monooxygenase YgiN
MRDRIGRRELIAGAALAAAAGCAPATRPAASVRPLTDAPFYGRIGQIKSAPGARDRLVYLLLEGSANLPGCLSYIVAIDPADPDSIWITEAWDSEASHKASLVLPQVREAIDKARPIIAGFGESRVVAPVGGLGLRD